MSCNAWDHSDSIEFCADCILPKRSNLPLSSAEINQDGRLQVTIADEVLEYPAQWLRINCPCEKCFLPTALSFKYMISDVLNLNMQLKAVDITEKGVRCVFVDDHMVEMKTGWLYNRRMNKDGVEERKRCLSVDKMTLWTDPSAMKVQTCTYQQVTETDAGLEMFTDALVSDGIFRITDTPDRDVCTEFSEKTGLFPVPTHYGSRFWVANKPSPTNFAYTTVAIDFHVDLAYLGYYPCIQILHCKKQAKVGGENMLVDGIKAAHILRERFPHHYDMLTKIHFRHEDVISVVGQRQFYMSATNPVIIVDDQGEPRRIRVNGSSHSSFFPGSVEEYERFTEALKEFYQILSECSIKMKSDEGDIIVFDNQRLMHARLGYLSTEQRELEGWYIDWDSVYSRRRINRIKSMNKASE